MLYVRKTYYHTAKDRPQKIIYFTKLQVSIMAKWLERRDCNCELGVGSHVVWKIASLCIPLCFAVAIFAFG